MPFSIPTDSYSETRIETDTNLSKRKILWLLCFPGVMFPHLRQVWSEHIQWKDNVENPHVWEDNIGLSKKMDGIWNRYNLKSTGRIYTFGILKCSEKFKVLDLP